MWLAILLLLNCLKGLYFQLSNEAAFRSIEVNRLLLKIIASHGSICSVSRYSNIFVTSPSPDNLITFFEFVFKGFDALQYQVRK